MEYLLVRNWSTFQHYRDRDPPWIKLHRNLMDNWDFSSLPDNSKAHLVMIWLLASQNGGKVPNDPAFLARKLGFHQLPDLKSLIQNGFLYLEQDASKPLADRLQDAPGHARLEEERRGEEIQEASAYVSKKASTRKNPKTSLPNGFEVSERVRAWAAKKGFGNIDEHFDHFVLSAQAKGYTYSDWDSALMKAISGNWANISQSKQNGATMFSGAI